MEETSLNHQQLQEFQCALYSDEKSSATIRKYRHDVEVFFQYAQGRPVTKELVVSYKHYLLERYAVSSANTMLASLNRFFAWAGIPELRVKTVKCQRSIFSGEKELTKKEYLHLLNAAQKQKKFWLRLVMETICATGIRVSELRHITVEAVRRGTAKITCKGKHRRVLLLCADILNDREGHHQIGGHPGPHQCEHHPALHHFRRSGAPQAAESTGKSSPAITT